MKLYFDCETFSPTPIGHGTFAYAESAFMILIMFAVDDQPVEVWEVNEESLASLRILIDMADWVVIQNSIFDRTVARICHNIVIPPEKIIDTMALAYLHGLPGALGKLCEVFGLDADVAKDKSGKALIHLFCKPTKEGVRIMPADEPQKWNDFREYGASDVRSMREIERRLPRWSDTPVERALWLLDQRVNDYGISVDADLAHAAVETLADEKRRLDRETDERTDGAVTSATQRDKLLAYLLASYDVQLPDMQAATLERRIEDESLPEPVRELLRIRLSSTRASNAKYKRILEALSADGMLRGCIQYAGAWRTQRWAGRVFQPHNLPRPQFKKAEIEEGIEIIKAGAATFLLPDINQMCSSALRGLLVARPGHTLRIADLSNIEGRKLSWLAGEDWKVQAYAEFDRGIGHDMYKISYGRSLRVDPAEVDDEQRQIGKVIELALGYQGAAGAFQKMAEVYGVKLPLKVVIELVRAWRRANSNIANFWYACEAAARLVTTEVDQSVEVGRVRFDRQKAWMRIELPSGRFLSYPSPAIKWFKCAECRGRGSIDEFDDETMSLIVEECEVCHGKGGKQSMSFLGMNPYTKKFGRVQTYGGKLVENITQASSRDALGDCMLRADAAGFRILLTVHDEIIAETPDGSALDGKALGELMSQEISWAPGLPLAAKGYDSKRYGKEK